MIALRDVGGERGLALRLVSALGATPDARRTVARVFDVSERTLRRWMARWTRGEAPVRRRGRRTAPVPRRIRQQVIDAMIELGPCAGVPVLRGLFGTVPYRLLAAMKRRFVHVLQRRYAWYRRKLEWLRVGATWAMDFTEPTATLPDDHETLLVVRDLGSGAQLAAQPCAGERASAVCALLSALFLTLGIPLLIKADNGGAFRAKDTQRLLAEHGVACLFSPPYWPQYNGACERSGGTLKKRIEHEALKRGRPGRWTRRDIDRAMRLANMTARPRGARRPTPAEAFALRRPITPGERAAFRRCCAQAREARLATFQSKHGTMPTWHERASIDRDAVQHALLEGSYLRFRRGRLSTPVQTWRADIKA